MPPRERSGRRRRWRGAITGQREMKCFTRSHEANRAHRYERRVVRLLSVTRSKGVPTRLPSGDQRGSAPGVAADIEERAAGVVGMPDEVERRLVGADDVVAPAGETAADPRVIRSPSNATAGRYPVARITSSNGVSVPSAKRTPPIVNRSMAGFAGIAPGTDGVDQLESDQRHHARTRRHAAAAASRVRGSAPKRGRRRTGSTAARARGSRRRATAKYCAGTPRSAAARPRGARADRHGHPRPGRRQLGEQFRRRSFRRRRPAHGGARIRPAADSRGCGDPAGECGAAGNIRRHGVGRDPGGDHQRASTDGRAARVDHPAGTVGTAHRRHVGVRSHRQPVFGRISAEIFQELAAAGKQRRRPWNAIPGSAERCLPVCRTRLS